VVGLALDFCVLKTAISGVKHGYTVYIVEDATRAIDKSSIKAKIQSELEAFYPNQ
jgi:nicotinamidase/pyrazinamidase